MIVNKRHIIKCDLRFGEVRIKRVQKFIYVGNTITGDGKCDIEIQSKRCLPETKQSIKKWKVFGRKKAKNAKLLHHMYHLK